MRGRRDGPRPDHRHGHELGQPGDPITTTTTTTTTITATTTAASSAKPAIRSRPDHQDLDPIRQLLQVELRVGSPC